MRDFRLIGGGCYVPTIGVGALGRDLADLAVDESQHADVVKVGAERGGALARRAVPVICFTRSGTRRLFPALEMIGDYSLPDHKSGTSSVGPSLFKRRSDFEVTRWLLRATVANVS